MKKRVLITSAVTILLCLCLIAGSTFALFTASTSASIVVQSATVSIGANINNLRAFSLTYGTPKKDQAGKWIFDECTAKDAQGRILFANGGTVALSGNNLTLDRLSPGDKVSFTINVTNGSNIETQCRVLTNMSGDLASGLKVSCTSGDMTIDGNWFVMNGATGTITVTVELPVEAGNDYQNKSFNMTVQIEAIQANGAGIPVDGNGTPIN